MIDTEKYEGHTPAPWVEGEYIPSDEMIERFQNRELQGAVMQRDSNIMVAMIGLDDAGAKDRKLMADAPKLLAEVKRLRKLEAAVVGSWMETINRGSSWHKQLRDPCVELGYLTHDDCYELPEEYQDMAKEWVKENYGDEEE